MSLANESCYAIWKIGKLSQRYIGTNEIPNRVRGVAYYLSVPPEMSIIHSVFHVSMQRKFMSDYSRVLEKQALQLDVENQWQLLID